MAARLLRRASSQIPLAACSTRSLSESSSSVVLCLRSRYLPFSTSSSSSGPETPNKSPPFSFATSDKLSVPDGVPFDSVEKDPEGQSVTLTRKTKDEVIEVQVKALEKDLNVKCVPRLSFLVRILYGDNFNRCFEAECHASPTNDFAIREISIRNEEKSGSRKHLEEFEDFFKERGIEPCNINFVVDYLLKRNETV